MKMGRAVFSIGGLTLVSRVLGFFRDMITASILGAGPIADAFFLAYRLPNFFRRFLGEGAFSAAFVPKFTGILTHQGEEKAFAFARNTQSFMAILLAVIVITFEIFMPTVIRIIAPGFDRGGQAYELAVLFARLMMPYLFFICLVALYGGVLNALHRFAAFAAAPILLNGILVLSLLILAPILPSAGHALSYGVLIAGFVQFLWMIFCAIRPKVVLAPQAPVWNSDIKSLLKLIGPGLVGSSVFQINVLMDTFLASFLASGSISYLYYADRLNQLPLGVLGIAIGTALLPILTKQFKEKNLTEAMYTQNRALELSLLLAIPCGVGLFLLSPMIMTTLFERGEFSPHDALMSAYALSAFSLGLPAYILVKVLSTGFYANEDTVTPVKSAGISVLVNFVLNVTLMQFMAHVGLALSTAIAAWVNAMILMKQLRKKDIFHPDALLKSNMIKLAGALTAMVIVIEVCKNFIIPDNLDNNLARVFYLALTIGSAGTLYLGLTYRLKIWNIDELKEFMKNRKKKKK